MQLPLALLTLALLSPTMLAYLPLHVRRATQLHPRLVTQTLRAASNKGYQGKPDKYNPNKAKPNYKKKKQAFAINPNYETEFDPGAITSSLDSMVDGSDGSFGNKVSSTVQGKYKATTFQTPVGVGDSGDAGDGGEYVDDLSLDDYDLDFDDDDDLDFSDATLTDTSNLPLDTSDMKSRLANARSSEPSLGDLGARGKGEKARPRREIREEREGMIEEPEEDDYTLRPVRIHDGTCPGCGVTFQTKKEDLVGFIPRDKFTIVEKCIEWSKQQAKKEREWTPEAEVDFLIAEAAPEPSQEEPVEIPFTPPNKPVICRRCFDLSNGNIPAAPTTTTSQDPYLSLDSFKHILSSALKTHASDSVVLIMVDLWDFGPAGALEPINAILKELPFAPPVILAVNKADLFPQQLSPLRAESWVRRELEYHDIDCVRGEKGDVRLISALTGYGVKSLISKVIGLMDDNDVHNVFVCGGANVGKSTMLNRIIEDSRKSRKGPKGKEKLKPGKANKKNNSAGLVTTSPLPGTTLGVISMDLGDGKTLMDTPGLLIDGSLGRLLTGAEMKMVTPKKANPITFRVEPGSSVMIGGLARVDVTNKEGNKAFMVTVWVGSEMTLHATKTAKAEEVLVKHVGGIISPPMTVEGLERLGSFTDHTFDIEGKGWKESAADITLRGLGWVSITGAGTASINVRVPAGVGVDVRPPLMPFDNWEYTGKFTGGRVMNKQKAKGRRKTGDKGSQKPKPRN